MRLDYTAIVFKEGKSFVAHSPELDVSSCASSKRKALENLAEAVELFVDEARRMGTLEQILAEAGYTRGKSILAPPRMIAHERQSLSVPQLDARP